MKRFNQNRQISAYILAMIGVILFSLKAIFVKKAYEYDIDTISLLLIRMLFSFPVYFIIAIITTWKARKKSLPGSMDILFMILMGLFGYYLSSYLDFSGLHYISASLERTILYTYPAIVVLISALVFNKIIPQKQIIAIIITYFGIFLAFSQNLAGSEHGNIFKGGLFILACAFTYSCYLVGSERLIPVFGSLRYTSYAMIIACIAVIIHRNTITVTPITTYPAEVYWIGIGMAIFSTVLPSFMISEAIRRIGAPVVAIIGSIGPVVTVVFEAFFLHAKISVFEGLGTVIVISGILLITNTDTSGAISNNEENKLAA